MKRNVLIFLYRFPLIGVMTLRRLVGKYICLTQRRLMIRVLPQIIRDYREPLETDQFNYGVNLSHQHQEMKQQLERI